MWDFQGLNATEEKVHFSGLPSEFTFGAGLVRIEQQPLPEDLEPESTGSVVWPAAEALARYLERASHRTDIVRVAGALEQAAVHELSDDPRGRCVLELGAGTGLVGLAAWALGAESVLLTDVSEGLPRLQRNAELTTEAAPASAASPEVIQVACWDWRDGIRTSKHFDMVLCADCVVWPDLVEPLCNTLRLVTPPQGVVLLSLVFRDATAGSFLTALRRRFQVTEVWASSAGGGRPDGFMCICRARRWDSASVGHAAANKATSGESEARQHSDSKEIRSAVERVIGAPVGSVADLHYFADFAPNEENSGATDNFTKTCRLGLTPSDPDKHGDVIPKTILLKRALIGPDSEREATWFQDFHEVLRAQGLPLPRCYGCWMEAPPPCATEDDPDGDATQHFAAVLEDLSAPLWERRTRFLREEEVRAALGWLAKFHGSTMGNSELLQRAEHKLGVQKKGSESASSPEVKAAGVRWKQFVRQYSQLDRPLFERAGSLIKRLCKATGEIDQGLALEDGRGKCIVHGNLRVGQLAFSAERTPMRSVPRSFNCVGVGAAVRDVAQLLLSSAAIGLVANGASLRLLLTSAYIWPLLSETKPWLTHSPSSFFSYLRMAMLDVGREVLIEAISKEGPLMKQELSRTLGLVHCLDRLLQGEELPGFAHEDNFKETRWLWAEDGETFKHDVVLLANGRLQMSPHMTRSPFDRKAAVHLIGGRNWFLSTNGQFTEEWCFRVGGEVESLTKEWRGKWSMFIGGVVRVDVLGLPEMIFVVESNAMMAWLASPMTDPVAVIVPATSPSRFAGNGPEGFQPSEGGEWKALPEHKLALHLEGVEHLLCMEDNHAWGWLEAPLHVTPVPLLVRAELLVADVANSNWVWAHDGVNFDHSVALLENGQVKFGADWIDPDGSWQLLPRNRLAMRLFGIDHVVVLEDGGRWGWLACPAREPPSLAWRHTETEDSLRGRCWISQENGAWWCYLRLLAERRMAFSGDSHEGLWQALHRGRVVASFGGSRHLLHFGDGGEWLWLKSPGGPSQALLTVASDVETERGGGYVNSRWHLSFDLLHWDIFMVLLDGGAVSFQGGEPTGAWMFVPGRLIIDFSDTRYVMRLHGKGDWAWLEQPLLNPPTFMTRVR